MKTTQNSLFQITQNRITLEAVLEELGGELSPELEAALALNQEELATKGESYIYVLEQILAYTEMNKRYIEKATTNIARAEKTAERLKERLLDAAKIYGKFEAGIHTVGTRKSSAVVIDDADAIPEIYTKRTVKTDPVKKLIGEAIAAGIEVPGAHVEERLNLKIS